MKNLSLLQLILLASILFTSGTSAHASFNQNQRRYLTSMQFYFLWHQYFSADPQTAGSDGNVLIFGASDPKSGSPILQNPSSATITIITNAVSKATANATTFVGPPGSPLSRQERLLGKHFTAWLKAQPAPESNRLQQILGQTWTSLDPSLKVSLIQDMVRELLGPDEQIKDFGFIKNPDDYRAKLLNLINQNASATVLDGVRTITMNLMTRDEFLSY